jgi:hypothetical protein
MPTPTMTTCRSCGAAIFYARHQGSGKEMPINAGARIDGNVLLAEDGRYTVLGKAQLAALPTPRPPLYVTHFATCPHAPGWRKR